MDSNRLLSILRKLSENFNSHQTEGQFYFVLSCVDSLSFNVPNTDISISLMVDTKKNYVRFYAFWEDLENPTEGMSIQ